MIGYDDILLAGYTSPALTTIRQDVGYGADLLVDLLLARIAGQSVGSVAMLPELIIRDSA